MTEYKKLRELHQAAARFNERFDLQILWIITRKTACSPGGRVSLTKTRQHVVQYKQWGRGWIGNTRSKAPPNNITAVAAGTKD